MATQGVTVKAIGRKAHAGEDLAGQLGKRRIAEAVPLQRLEMVIKNFRKVQRALGQRAAAVGSTVW